MERKKRLEKRSREIYLSGLQQYQDKGIPILIDGKETVPSEWERIFEVHEDGSFYMGDYILDEESQNGKCLKEIRFDKVYYR